MTKRELMKKALNNEPVDQVLFSPRLEIWYNYHKERKSLPEEFKNDDLREIERKLGVIHPARKGPIISKKISDNVETYATKEDNEITKKTYRTPYGEITETYANFDHLMAGKQVPQKRLWKSQSDYEAVGFLIDNIKIEAEYEKFREYDQWVGNEGVPIAKLGNDPFYEVIRNYMGFESGYKEVINNKQQFNILYKKMKSKYLEMQEIALNSQAEYILHGQHYDSKMTPPFIFNEFIAPYLSEFAAKLHNKNKKLVIHADADLKLLLDNVVNVGIDVAECFVCSPAVNLKLEEAMEAWKDKVVIWGGIPSTMLVPDCFDEKEFSNYMKGVFDVINKYDNKGLILGIGDNTTPLADIQRIKIIIDMVNNI